MNVINDETIVNEVPETVPETTESPSEITVDTPSESQEEEVKQVAKTYTQDQVDAINAKTRLKAERKAAREYAERLEAINRKPVESQVNSNRPNREQFNDEADYIEAVTDWKLDQREQVKQTQKQGEAQKATLEKTESLYAEAEKLDGFDRDVFDDLPLTKTIAEAIIDSDVSAKLMLHLTNNPDEVDRIANLSPARQAAEIGKLEIKITTAKPKVSNAPEPIAPIGSRGSATKSPNDMTAAEFAKWREPFLRKR